MGDWVAEGLKDAGMIILITGAGGSLGAVLRETAMQTSSHLPCRAYVWGTGAIYLGGGPEKQPRVPPQCHHYHRRNCLASFGSLRFGGGHWSGSSGNGCWGRIHDCLRTSSYFWVVAQFSDMKVSEAYRLQTLATLVTGVVGLITVAFCTCSSSRK